MSLEERVKALEELFERISAAILGAPVEPSAKQPIQTQQGDRSVDDIKMSFPEELEARLNFTDKGDYIYVKPKAFLGSENFARTSSAIRGMGGEYVSAGKDSHFRIPKRKR